MNDAPRPMHVAIDSILLATDFSPYSERAEAMTVKLAGALGASVTAIHVIEPIAGLEDGELSDFYSDLARRSRSKMDALVERLEAEGVVIEGVVTTGKRWHRIVEYADGHHVGLVVVGSHGVYEHGKPYIGTTSHRVVLGTNVPVMVVRWDDD